MGQFFQFEEDFATSLRCIPMQVRFKLDTAGVKLKLTHWHQLTPQERQQIMDAPCETSDDCQTYRTLLHHLIDQHGGDRPSDLAIDPHPDWLNQTTVPDSVQQKAQSLGVALGRSQWAALSPLQRFALIKLSRSNHENKNFLPALREFGLIDAS